jgi:hypothetical protein
VRDENETGYHWKGMPSMSEELVNRIETKIEQSAGLSDEVRSELNGLLATLKEEMAELQKTQSEKAESIAGFAGAAAHEAMRTETNPHLLELAIAGLSSSVKEVETEHPQLVKITNTICTMLSNLGI